MANHEKERHTWTFVWAPDQKYTFEYTEHSHRTCKLVFRGKFLDEAPEGVEPGTPCCLKEIVPTDNEHPQHREMFELVAFQGDHLRHILAANDAAKDISSRLLKGRTTPNTPDKCYIVEPLGVPCDTILSKVPELTVTERLDIVHQFALGSQELNDEVNALGGNRIVAHRDLKLSNGILDPHSDKIHIRLFDFASVALEQNQTLQSQAVVSPASAPTQSARKGTASAPMSPDNTAPEILMRENYPATDKTDVYALGMMLASLFVTYNGKYTNPNSIWCEHVGFNPNPTELRVRFDTCKQKYDRTATADNTWIEQDLRNEYQIALNWEHLSNDAVLSKIRELFFKSTRIEPKDRIDRPTFIRELERLMQRAESTNVHPQIPVSLYLFDRQDILLTKVGYMAAAARAFELDQQEARLRGEPAPMPLCISYRKQLRENEALIDCVQTMTPHPCGNINELSEVIGTIQQANGYGKNRLGLAVYVAYTILQEQKHRFSFTGNIHLFLPQLPRLQDIENVDRYSLFDILGMEGLGCLCDEPVQIVAHTMVAPSVDAEDEEWCSYELIVQSPLAKAYAVTADPPASPKVSQQEPDKAPTPTPATVTDSESRFLTGANAPYLLLNGKKIFVSQK